MDVLLPWRAGTGPAVLVLVALLAGCGTADTEPRDADGAEAAAEAGAREPEASVDAPVADGDDPELAGLLGVWLLDGGERLLLLSGDGRFAVDDRGVIDTSPAASGTFALDGRTLRFRNGRESAVCSEGADWSLDTGELDEGAIETVFVAGDDPRCPVGLGTRWTWTRVSPQSPRSLELGGDVRDDDGVAPDAAILRGVWLLEGTGILLRLGDDGTYALDDQGRLLEPADVGAFTAEEGVLALTTAAESRRCSEGDRLVWQVRLHAGPSREDDAGVARRGDWVLRGEVDADDCGHDAGPAGRWLLLSP